MKISQEWIKNESRRNQKSRMNQEWIENEQEWIIRAFIEKKEIKV